MGISFWFSGWIVSAAAAPALFIAPAAFADDNFAFLKVDAIRAAYTQAGNEWKPAPDLVENAFVAAEDRDFFDRSPSRSTLTAQLAFWYPERGGTRQLGGIGRSALTVAFGQALDHAEIVDWYVHSIFLGQGCFGVEGAAIAYFGKSMDALELHEAAYLAALARSPGSLHPHRAPDRALAQRNHVLKAMVKAGFVAMVQAENSKGKPLGVRDPLDRCAQAQR